MLKFNPSQRWSAEDCLRSKVFEQFKHLDLQQRALTRVYVEADEGIDFSTEELCRQAMVREISLIKTQGLK